MHTVSSNYAPNYVTTTTSHLLLSPNTAEPGGTGAVERLRDTAAIRNRAANNSSASREIEREVERTREKNGERWIEREKWREMERWREREKDN